METVAGGRGSHEGTHKGCPYGGVWQGGTFRGGGPGHPQGVPLRGCVAGGHFSGMRAWAPTRGAPTGVCGRRALLRDAGLGTHEGCPYGGVWQGGTSRGGGLGHPRGVPLRGVWQEGTSQGCGPGHPQGVPLRGCVAGGHFSGRRAWAPTRGAPTGVFGRRALLRAAGLGTHKGCPYGGVWQDGGSAGRRGTPTSHWPHTRCGARL